MRFSELPTWVVYTAPVVILLGGAMLRSAWFYQRYGKEAERRCKHVRGAEAHENCTGRELRKMGAPGFRVRRKG